MRDELTNLWHVVRRLGRSPKILEFLPAVPGRERTFEQSRCLYDGYQRSCALKYGSLGDQATRDPVYRKARAATKGHGIHTMVDEDKLISLFLIIKFFLRELPTQNVLEFGSFKGGSALFMATLLAEYYPGARVISLDTFTGIPDGNADVDAPPQSFVATNLERIRKRVHSLGLTNVEFVPGLIQDTALAACQKLGKVGLAHVDVVLYEPSVYAQNVVWDFMAPGGYLIQDDALEPTCPGATLAMEELIRERGLSLEQIWPQMVFRAGSPEWASLRDQEPTLAASETQRL